MSTPPAVDPDVESFLSGLDPRPMSQLFQFQGGALPPLSALNIDIQGQVGSGKTQLVVGDPHCIGVKLRDGTTRHCGADGKVSSLLRRCPGDPRRIVVVDTYEQLMSTLDSILQYAKRGYGPDGTFNCVFFDPIIELWSQAAGEYVTRHNSQYNSKLESFGDISGYDKWSTLGRSIKRIFLDQWGPLGWGYRTVTHYTMRIDNETKAMKWSCDVPNSTSSIIGSYADICLVCERLGDIGSPATQWRVLPTSAIHHSAKTRIPLKPFLVYNYDSQEGRSNPGATAYQCLYAEYLRACERHRIEYDNFVAACPGNAKSSR